MKSSNILKSFSTIKVSILVLSVFLKYGANQKRNQRAQTIFYQAIIAFINI